jgi:hypothetical protein
MLHTQKVKLEVNLFFIFYLEIFNIHVELRGEFHAGDAITVQ